MGYAFLHYSVDHDIFMHISAGSECATSAFYAKTKALLKATTWSKNNILSSVSLVTDYKIVILHICNTKFKNLAFVPMYLIKTKF